MAEDLELSLLCKETNFVDGYEEDEEKGIVVERIPIEISISQMGFPSETEEIIREMMEKEEMVRDCYIKRLVSGDLDLILRGRQALDWIFKACEELKFGPLCVYLSVNYFDRFLSVHDLPSGQAWTMQLLAVACLSLAAKLEETDVPMLIDLQVGDPRFTFEAKSIQRMELLVLSRLEWRLKVITPCSYIRYFLRKCDQEEEPSNTLIYRSLQVIVNTIKGSDFLEFRPCEVAAAVALSVSGSLQQHFDNSLLFSLLQMERVKKIVEMIESEGSSLCSQTPNGVLEVSASCFSFKTHHGSSSSSASYSH